MFSWVFDPLLFIYKELRFLEARLLQEGDPALCFVGHFAPLPRSRRKGQMATLSFNMQRAWPSRAK